MPNQLSKLDANQVLKSVYNQEANALQITNGAPIVAPSGSLEVAIDQSQDSIAIGDGNDLFTSTNVSSKIGLDVNIINTTIPISATDLDIRNLEFATDKVDVSGSSISIDDQPITNIYNEVLSVASGILTTITSFTASQSSKLKQVDVSGENIATFTVLVNGNVVSKKRTYFGGQLDNTFNFNNGIAVSSGQQILVQVIHNRPTVANFNANIAILEG